MTTPQADFRQLAIQLTDACLAGDDTKEWLLRSEIGVFLRQRACSFGVLPANLEFIADFSDCMGTILLLYNLAIGLSENRGEPTSSLRLSLSICIKEKDPAAAIRLLREVQEAQLDDDERISLFELKSELLAEGDIE